MSRIINLLALSLALLGGGCNLFDNLTPGEDLADVDPAFDYVTQGTWSIERVQARETERVSANSNPVVTLDTTFAPGSEITFLTNRRQGLYQGRYEASDGTAYEFQWDIEALDAAAIGITFYNLPVLPFAREVAHRLQNWEFEEMYLEARTDDFTSVDYRTDFILIE